MIQVRDITYKADDKYLVRDISVDFVPGALNLIIGPNGAGKSTLIKILSGQMHPESGTVQYAGKPLKDHTVIGQARIRAVLSQNIELAFPLSVYEVVMMGRYPHFTGNPEPKDVTACEEAMNFFGISDFAGRDYTTLSGGEKQRVQFARVLSQIWFPAEGQYRYLLLDEPLTFLDVHYQHQFMEQVKVLLKQGDLVVIGVVHDLNLAAKYAGNVTLLHNGKILATGIPEQVLTAENIRTAYQIEPKIILVEGIKYIFF